MSVAAAPPVAPAWERALRQFGARSFEAAPGAFTWIMLFAPAWIPIVFKLPGAIFVAALVLGFAAAWGAPPATLGTGGSLPLLPGWGARLGGGAPPPAPPPPRGAAAPPPPLPPP